jgi:methylamine dehydrogenase accessory protein MauD
MHGLVMGSYVALWIVVLLLSVGLAALAGQIGILYRRLEPAGARIMNAGPTIGEPVAPFVGVDIFGREVKLPGSDGRATLLMFVSPGCVMCDEVLPALKSVARQEKRYLSVVLASFSGNDTSNKAYVAQQDLSRWPYVFSFELAHRFAVSGAPYALLMDGEGVLRTKGLVNSREHLDSLLNVLDGEYENVQSFWASQQPRPESTKIEIGSGSTVEEAGARG